MTSFYTAEVTLPYITNLPRDVTVNTFHFQSAEGEASIAGANQVAQRLSDFYGGVTTAGALWAFLSNEIGPLATVKVYDPTTAPVGPPGHAQRPVLYQDTFGFGTSRSSPTDMPPEVALCLSYYGTANVARQRGRVYIGPFCQIAEALSVAYAAPTPGLISSMTEAGARLCKNTGSVAQGPTTLLPTTPATGPATVLWSVRSKYIGDVVAPGGTYTIVNNGWCDNEWDSQRRRRVAATTRQLFTAS